MDLEINVFEPAYFVTTDGTRLDGEKEPWFKAWYSTKQTPPLAWRDLLPNLSRDFINDSHLSETIYNDRVKKFRSPVMKYTIFYTVKTACDSGVYLLSCKDPANGRRNCLLTSLGWD